MRKHRTLRERRKEAGVALLISIFVLLLISVVAIAMIVSSGTESSLAGNYRASTNANYAALAGIEEVRARLRGSDPNSFKNTANFLPPAGTPLAVCSPVYLLNPNGAEVVAPWDPGNAYYDSEFGQEFPNDCGGAPPPNPSKNTTSVWNINPLNGLPFSGPLYKWVRINGVSEKSLNLDTFPYDRSIDANLLYYDGTHLTDVNTGGQTQVLEVTAFAVLPNGSQKLLQYLTAPSAGTVTLVPLPAALTLAGSTASNVVGYSAPPTTGGFGIRGLDGDCSGAATGAKFTAIGVVNNTDINVVENGGVVNGITYTGIPTAYRPNYPGLSTAPDVENVSSNFSATQLTPSGLDAMVQSVVQNADGTIPAGSSSAQSYLTSLVSSGAMSSSSPMTLVANGDLDLTSWHNTGYGLLLVTGKLTYDPDVSWNGIILVIGQGTVVGSHGGSGVINGAMLVARTRDSSGNLLPGANLGYSYVNFNPNGSSMGGIGINYSNCWVQKSSPVSRANYRILSFHEIGQ